MTAEFTREKLQGVYRTWSGPYGDPLVTRLAAFALATLDALEDERKARDEDVGVLGDFRRAYRGLCIPIRVAQAWEDARSRLAQHEQDRERKPDTDTTFLPPC